MAKIEASTKVHEIIREFPELTDYFLELGVCGCNDGHVSDLMWPIAKVAKEKHKDLNLLLEELNKRITK